MDWLREVVDIFLRLDVHLNEAAASMGGWLYALLFAIVFAETGLVVTPFLPGDSLLFAVGALAATQGSPIDVVLVGVLLTVAAVLGDAVNYQVGKILGPKVFSRTDSKLLNQQHLVRAQRFYERYGGKTIVIARFVPIIRTFAPFVAGIGKMGYARFATFNVVGALVWVWSFLLIGYWFGNRPFVKQNFTLVIGVIILISVMPAVVEVVRARRESARARAQEPPQG